MKKIKLLIVIIEVIVTAAVLTSVFTVNAGGIFPDIKQGQWYYSAVTRLSQTGVVNGFDDGYFHPDETLTAAQFIKMLFYDTDIPYTEGGEWWQPYYQAGVKVGIIDQTIMTESVMDLPLNRYQAVKLLSGLGIKTSAPEGFKAVPDTDNVRASIRDLNSMPVNYVSAVVDVCASGIMQGYDDGNFHGSDGLTRAQAAQIILRLYNEDQRKPVCKYVSTENLPAGDNRLTDTLIIGNSHAGGLKEYGGLSGAEIYYCNGISVYGLADAKFTSPDKKCVSVTDALSSGKYSKVILVFGTNEMAADPDYFYGSYCKFTDQVKKYQSGADIYISTAPPVNESMVDYPGSFNNKNVVRANGVIGRVAKDKNLKIIDIYSQVVDSDGGLPKEDTRDGIHFNSKYYEVWGECISNSVA